MKRNVTSLPLHHGRAPRWLFEKMTRLSAAIAGLIIVEFGTTELLRRLADPLWFQAFGCVCGFDWHSSGLTTTLCGALKEGLVSSGNGFPIAVCGGKGRRAIETPQEMIKKGEVLGLDVSPLVATSRMVAKIDNTLIQDGYSLYHHVFIFSGQGEWTVIQQGMNGQDRSARRYQWFSQENLDMVCEPHTGITCDETKNKVLDLVSVESTGTRKAVLDFIGENPDRMTETWKQITLSLPERHYISATDVDEKRLSKMFRILHESQANRFEDVMMVKGVGPKTMAALTLVSELVYEAPPGFTDPARFSFAHGGKDGHPFPVDKKTYEKSIEFLQTCLDRAQLQDRDRLEGFKRLSSYHQKTVF